MKKALIWSFVFVALFAGFLFLRQADFDFFDSEDGLSDSFIKSSLIDFQNKSSAYRNYYGTYDGVCKRLDSGLPDTIFCEGRDRHYIVYVPLPDSGDFFCIDSDGTATEINFAPKESRCPIKI